MDLEKYTDRSRGFIQSAQGLAVRSGHQRFTPEHLLKVLLDCGHILFGPGLERGADDVLAHVHVRPGPGVLQRRQLFGESDETVARRARAAAARTRGSSSCRSTPRHAIAASRLPGVMRGRRAVAVPGVHGRCDRPHAVQEAAMLRHAVAEDDPEASADLRPVQRAQQADCR